MAAILDLERPPAQGVDDVDHELVRLEGLQHVAVDAMPEGRLGVVAVVEAGHHHDRCLGMVARHLAREVEPRLARHVDVAQDQRDPLGGEQLARLDRARRGPAVEAVPAEQAGQQGPDRRFVVDDEDPLVCGVDVHSGRYRQGKALS